VPGADADCMAKVATTVIDASAIGCACAGAAVAGFRPAPADEHTAAMPALRVERVEALLLTRTGDGPRHETTWQPSEVQR
jgi:hypothetical protein